VLAIIAVLSLLAWNYYRTAPTEIVLNGRILISEPVNIAASGDTCSGTGDLASLTENTTIAISTATNDPVEATIQSGVINDAGECELTFTASVPDALAYTFRVESLPELVRDQYIIDGKSDSGKMILTPILRWD
jgi:hypothetical protein